MVEHLALSRLGLRDEVLAQDVKHVLAHTLKLGLDLLAVLQAYSDISNHCCVLSCLPLTSRMIPTCLSLPLASSFCSIELMILHDARRVPTTFL